MYCTSAIPNGLNCIGKNQKQCAIFKPLKHNRQKKKKVEIKNNKLAPPQQSQLHILVIKILIKTEVLQSKAGRTTPRFWLTIHA